MRTPTLHERISIKGVLSRRGVPGQHLVKANTMGALLHYWYRCCGRPLCQYYVS